ncbi:M23 family metallopeptidase [Streptomyces sp. NPDC049879]|uniref:M23 family metallopeptidase n=1 Tax=Streptomyces sp. NPDC049879 TaxID=3365598 RepID=UPI00379F6CD2
MRPLPRHRHERRPARLSPSAARLTRRVVGGTLAGALAIAGPWTLLSGDGDDGSRGALAAGAVEDGAPRGSAVTAERAYGPPPYGAEPPLRSLPETPEPPAFPPLPRLAQPSWFPELPPLPDAATPAERWVPYGLWEEPFGRARGRRADDGPAADGWTAPVSGHPVSASYGDPGDWAAGYHTGVDFATPVGTPVSSVGPGTVVTAGWSGDYGNLVIVRMEDGHYVLYAHLSDIAVAEGRDVRGGTALGETGNTGNSTGPHLHFEVRAGRDYGTDVDPLAYLADHGVTLG